MPTSKRKTLSLGTTAPVTGPTQSEALAAAQALLLKQATPPTVHDDLSGTVGPAAPVLRTASAVPGGLWADRTAAKMADDAEFGEHMEEAWEAEEVSKKKVVQVLFDLRQIFTIEDMDTFPQLEPKLKELPAGSNLFIDEYPTIGKDKDGKDKPKTGSRYYDLAHKLPWVAKAQKNYEYFKTAKADPTKRQDEHIPWQGSMFDTEIQKHNQRVRNAVNMIRSAMQLHFQMQRINTLPLVGCAMQTIGLRNADGTPANDDMTGKQRRMLVSAASPLTLFSHTERDPDTNQILNSALSSGAFLQLNVDKAIEKAGGVDKVTYGILLASAGRQTKGPDTQPPTIKNIEAFEGIMAEVAAFLEQDHNGQRLRALIAGRDKKGEPLMSDHYVLSIQKAFVVLEGIVTQPEFAGRAKVVWAIEAEREAQARKLAAQVKAA